MISKPTKRKIMLEFLAILKNQQNTDA